MAKQIIAQWDGLDLPSHSVTASREVLGRRTLFKSETIPPTRFIVRSSMVELGQDGFKPDVVLQGDEGQRLAIEVWVTHKVGSEKRNRIVAADLATLEYDLSAQRHERWDRASLEVALLEMAAGWVHHPAEARIRARLEADVLEEAAHLIHPVETNHGVPSAEADMFAFETARSDALSYGVTSHEISFQL